MTNSMAIEAVNNEESQTSFLYLLMNAVENSIDVMTLAQLTSSISTAQVAESMNDMILQGTEDMAEQADTIANLDPDDKDYSEQLTAEQVKYNQMAQEEASKETMMNGVLGVTEQTTTSYASTLQQLIQTGSITGQVAVSVGQMLEKGYRG